MNKASVLKELSASMVITTNPAAPSDEFLALEREGAVLNQEERAAIVKAIDAAPVHQVAEAFAAIGGILRKFLAP